MSRHIRTVFLSIFFLLNFVFAKAEIGLSSYLPGPTAKKSFSKTITSSFNLKMMPAFYWNTVGFEFEYVVKPFITIGVSSLYKWGKLETVNTNFKVRPQDFFKSGAHLELFARYYFDKTAPVGFYLQASVGYGQLIYEDGNTRPFSLLQQKRDFSSLRATNEIELPKPILFGLAGGYQLPIIPRHRVIANILLGIQGQSDAQGKMFVSIYLAPSIGYMFK